MVSDIHHVIPPDGGWGWAVVVGCFLIHFFMDGLLYSFGVFYIEFNDYFHSDKGVTSLIGSLLNGMNLLAGPIASLLINKYGSRAVAVSGAVMSSLGFVLSAFVPNVYWLIITFGLVPGIGSAFLFVSAVVSVGHYFEKRRSFAMGIAVCGSGIGTFIFAPLTEYLVECYTWKGAVLFEAGIMLNCAIGGMLFKPLYANDKRSDTEKQPHAICKLRNAEEQLHANGKLIHTEQHHENCKLISTEDKRDANGICIDTEEIEKANEKCNGISHSDNEASLQLTGIYVCLMSIVLVEFVGIHNLTSSFGVMLLFKGIVLLAGVPSAGLLYDVTGSYAVTFYSAGAIIFLAAILVFIGCIINQKRNVKDTDKCLSYE